MDNSLVKENYGWLSSYNKSMAVAIGKAERGSDVEDGYFMEKLEHTADLMDCKLVKKS